MARCMFAQLPTRILISVKHSKPGHSHRKPDLTTEPERMVRRLLEPSVDQAEKKEYERCAFPSLCGGVNSDAVIQVDMLTRNTRSEHAANRTLTRQICTKQTCRFTVPTCKYAKQSQRAGPSMGRSPKPCGRQRTAEDIYGAYVLQPERNMYVSRNDSAGVLVTSTGDS